MYRFALMLCCVLPSCALPPQGADFESDDPAERVNAVALAAREGDRTKLRELADELDSSDAGLRLLSSRALIELNNGETFGYDDQAPPSKRREAMKRWQAWADQQEQAARVTP